MMLNQKRMPNPTTKLKVQKFSEQNVISQLESWRQQLSDGDLYDLETELSAQPSVLHDLVCKVVLPVAAEQAYEGLLHMA